MRTRMPDYLEQFQCLAGDCPDTCCGPWEIVVDDEAKARFLTWQDDLGASVRSVLTEWDGETCMSVIDGHCAMLTADGLCPIVAQKGQEGLPETCRAHPRFTEVYGGLQETILAVSCPAAAKLLLEREEPLKFVTVTDDVPPEPNDLDGNLFYWVMQTRETAMAIVQNRRWPLVDRLALLARFGARVEDNLERPAVLDGLCAFYENEEYQRRELVRLKRLRRFGTLTRVRQVLLAMEHLGTEFPKHLEELEWVRPEGVALEQLTVYFLYRWWLKAACNGFVWRQTAAVVTGVLAVAGLARTVGSVEDAARLFGKEVEHSEENVALLKKAMGLECFGVREILRML